MNILTLKTSFSPLERPNLTMQIGENDPLIVGRSEEIERLSCESGAAYVRGVWAESLDETSTSRTDVPQDASAVLLTHGEELSRGVHANGGRGAACDT